MNRIGIAIFMVIMAGIFCGCEIFTVNRSTDEYNQELENISRLVNEESFDTAMELSEKLLNKWKRSAKHLDKYLYHDYIDDITENIATLPVYAQSKDKTAVNAQIENIKIQLTSLKESELPYMHNIL